MDPDRRKFLQALASVCGAGFARSLGIGTATAVVASAPAAAATAAAATVKAGAYGAGVRAQVFEVVVRQGIAGAPWKEICAGPLRVNNISEAEVEAEIARRTAAAKPHALPYSPGGLDAYRKFKEAINSIPHSPVAPCACSNCSDFIRAKWREIREQVYKDA